MPYTVVSMWYCIDDWWHSINYSCPDVQLCITLTIERMQMTLFINFYDYTVVHRDIYYETRTSKSRAINPGCSKSNSVHVTIDRALNLWNWFWVRVHIKWVRLSLNARDMLVEPHYNENMFTKPEMLTKLHHACSSKTGANRTCVPFTSFWYGCDWHFTHV